MPQATHVKARHSEIAEIPSGIGNARRNAMEQALPRLERPATNQRRGENIQPPHGLRRLSSVTALAGPINHLKTKLRGPSAPLGPIAPTLGQRATRMLEVRQDIRKESKSSGMAPWVSRDTKASLERKVSRTQPPLIKSHTMSQLTQPFVPRSTYTRLSSPQKYVPKTQDGIANRKIDVRTHSHVDQTGAVRDGPAETAASARTSVGDHQNAVRSSFTFIPGLTAKEYETCDSAKEGLGRFGRQMAEKMPRPGHARPEPRGYLRTATGTVLPTTPSGLPRAATMNALNSKSSLHPSNSRFEGQWPLKDHYSGRHMDVQEALRDQSEPQADADSASLPMADETSFPRRRSYQHDINFQSLMQPLSPSMLQASPRLMVNVSASTPSSLAFARQVSQAQPGGYWAGRYTSMTDQLVNESFQSSKPSISFSSSGNTRNAFDMASDVDSELHARKIFAMLYESCNTEEAVESLREFQMQYADLKRLPNLKTFSPLKATPVRDKGKATIMTGRSRNYLSKTSGNNVRLVFRGDKGSNSSLGSHDGLLGNSNDSSEPGTLGDLPESAKKERLLNRLLKGRRHSNFKEKWTGDENTAPMNLKGSG